MKTCIFFLLAAILLVAQISAAPTAIAQTGTKVSALVTDCAAEIKTYCSQVTPGDDRVVACLIAYEDKVSARCGLTAYLASGNLGARLKQVQSMAKTCSSDIAQYCSGVPVGGGRIYDCIKKNRATLTDECRKGLDTLAPL